MKATGCVWGVVLAMALVGCQGGESSLESDALQSRACLEHASNIYRVTYDLTLADVPDGTSVYGVTEIGLAFAEATCIALSQAEVEGGQARLELANRTDEAVYPLLGAFIDIDDDGLCTPGTDRIWSSWGGAQPNRTARIVLEDDDFGPTDQHTICSYF